MSNFVAGDCKNCEGVVIWFDVNPPHYICSDCGRSEPDGDLPKWVKKSRTEFGRPSDEHKTTDLQSHKQKEIHS